MSPYLRPTSFVDRYTLSPHPPSLTLHNPHIPNPLRPHIAQADRLSRLFDNAFPPCNAPFPPCNLTSTSRLTLQSFQRAVKELDGPLNTLIFPLEHPDPPDVAYIHFIAETQIPRLLVSMLARVTHFLNFSNPTLLPPPTAPLPWKPYIPLIKHPASSQILHPFIVTLLRAINTLAASSDLLTTRLAEDPRLLPLLFSAIRVPNAVELSLALMEETLHSAPIRRAFDLSTIPSLPAIIHVLTPFQLGLFCRVLAPLVDERDIPLCGGDHCNGACSLPSHLPSNDWQRIEPAADQLRARRSYVKAADHALRDRNHAVLLAIPGLFQKLVKLIAVPPGPRDELLLVDHAIRSGAFTLNFDAADIIQEAPPQPAPLRATLVAIQGDPSADVVFGDNSPNAHGAAHPGNGPPEFGFHPDMQVVMDVQPLPTGEEPSNTEYGMPGFPPTANMADHNGAGQGAQAGGEAQAGVGGVSGGPSLPDEDQVRRRVLYMVFRKLTGMDAKDAELAGTQCWDVLDKRISKVEREHAKGSWDDQVFREKRRRSMLGTFGVDIRLAPGETHGFIDLSAVTSFLVDNAEGTQGENENGEQVDADGASANSAQQSPSGVATDGLRGQTGSDPSADDEENMCSELSINGMLMSSHQVEVLFVLYSMLIGRRKSDVQELLIGSGIFPVLSRFCDALDWTESARETKTEESLKLHYIRLLHYMCDGLDLEGGRLNLLFSDGEIDRLRAIETCPDTDVESTVLSSPASLKSSPEVATFGINSLSLSSSPIDDGSDLMDIKQSGMKRLAGDSHSQVMTSISLSLPCDTRRASEQRSRISPRSNPRTSKDWSLLVRKATSSSMKEDRDLGTRDVQSRGLLCKVTKILTKNHGRLSQDSTRRHLLSGCIESYLRWASSTQKSLIAEGGLLVHLLYELSESTKVPGQWNQFRQTSFDLLGQLVKWNRSLFNVMNEMFRRDPTLLPNLLKAVSDRLVDSNVFIRSLLISLEKFRCEDYAASINGETTVPYDFEGCLLWDFLETFRVRLLHDLLVSVRVEDLNFENICCVNTALILLVTSCGTEQCLDMFLSETVEMVLESMKANGDTRQSLRSLQPVEVFENFVKLINFWLSYYQYQSTDVASKELSSNIHFDRLVAMAMCLKERLPKLNELVRSYADRGFSEERVCTWN